MQCPECGGDLVLRNGKYGPFYGCSNFPDCRYTKKIFGDYHLDLDYESSEYGDETREYIESQSLRSWNPSMKKYNRRKNYNYRDDEY